MRAWMGALLASAAALGACSSESTATSTTGAGGSAGTTTTTTGAGGGTSATSTGTSATSTGTSTGSSSGAGGSAPTGVAINEISAKGSDWIELANAGTTSVDISGNGLCDSDDLGACNLVGAIRFPAGTTLAPGERVLIVLDKESDAGVGPFTDCLPTGGPATCFYAPWKVSASKGEKVHYITADNFPINEAEYPMDAVPSGQSWGRIPDLTGNFAANKPTPGAANESP
jgi:hypothetical protein